MAAISREELHRVVEQLPDDRLTAAAELLEALTLQDERASAWRLNLSPTDESEVAASLRREFMAEEWIADDNAAIWIDSAVDSDLYRSLAQPRGYA